MNTIKLFIVLLISGLMLIVSCKPDEEPDNNQNNNNTTVHEADNPLTLSIKDSKSKYVSGDRIKISIAGSKINDTDTVLLYMNKVKVAELDVVNTDFEWNSKTSKVGKNLIEIELNKNNKRFKKQMYIVLLSDIVPEFYTYKVKLYLVSK